MSISLVTDRADDVIRLAKVDWEAFIDRLNLPARSNEGLTRLFERADVFAE